MTHIITDKFKLLNAEEFIESIKERTDSVYYLYAGKHRPFDDDMNPPVTSTSIQELQYDQFNKMVFGKRVESADVTHMIRLVTWTTSTVYDMYDHTDVTLLDKDFYVISMEGSDYDIFKCLFNNNDALSTSQPLASETSASAESYTTADGYQWKYMYTIPAATHTKFAIATHVPVVPNADVIANAVSGAIDVIDVTISGSNYNSFANGLFTEISVGGNTLIFGVDAGSANTDFYKNSAIYIDTGTGAGQLRTISEYTTSGGNKRVILQSAWTTIPNLSSTYQISPEVTILGDGTGAQARGIVNATSSNSIASVQVIDRGIDYTFATATVTGNTGVIGVSNAAVNVIIGPPGGHGADVNCELDASFAGISITFANNETDTIPTNNDYRAVGIIRNPLFKEVTLAISNTNGSYTVGETVDEEGTNQANGIVTAANSTSITLTSSYGFFTATANAIGATSGANAFMDTVTQPTTTYDQRFTYQITPASGVLQEDEEVLQGAITARVHSTNTTIVTTTEQKGTFALTQISPPLTRSFTGNTSGGVVDLDAVILPDLVQYQGDIIYVENFEPITRSDTLSETIKITIGF